MNLSAQQKEAYLNEYKGNLFEYLVGRSLAEESGSLVNFDCQFNPDLRQRYIDYQRDLHLLDRELYKVLPSLAQDTARFLFQELELTKNLSIKVIGRLEASRGGIAQNEADILIKDYSFVYPVSLKFAKSGASVNTKSGGVKSFLTKYFHSIESCFFYQHQLSHLFDVHYAQFCRELHERHDLALNDRFGTTWKEAGLPVLPGDLDQEDSKTLQDFYYLLSRQLFETMNKLLQANPAQFRQSVLNLIGFSDESVIQTFCFYHHRQGRYCLDEIEIDHLRKSDPTQFIDIVPPKNGRSAFKILLSDRELDIRIKPMNKFVSGSFKINCGVKKRNVSESDKIIH